jgi:glutathione S-transferase
MSLHLYPAMATCLALLVYVWTIAACGRARGRFNVKAPAVTGHPIFERYFRIQQNTVEQLVLFLPSLWVFSLSVSQFWGGILGVIWVIGRIVYNISYAREPRSRLAGFCISGLATLILLCGGTVKVAMIMLTGRV